jgi:hypothetical protein
MSPVDRISGSGWPKSTPRTRRHPFYAIGSCGSVPDSWPTARRRSRWCSHLLTLKQPHWLFLKSGYGRTSRTWRTSPQTSWILPSTRPNLTSHQTTSRSEPAASFPTAPLRVCSHGFAGLFTRRSSGTSVLERTRYSSKPPQVTMTSKTVAISASSSSGEGSAPVASAVIIVSRVSASSAPVKHSASS